MSTNIIAVGMALLGLTGATISHHHGGGQKRGNVYFYYLSGSKQQGDYTLTSNWTIINVIPQCIGTQTPCFVITNSLYYPYLYSTQDLTSYIHTNGGFGILTVVHRN